jgi:hypothetical protein
LGLVVVGAVVDGADVVVVAVVVVEPDVVVDPVLVGGAEVVVEVVTDPVVVDGADVVVVAVVVAADVLEAVDEAELDPEPVDSTALPAPISCLLGMPDLDLPAR